MFDRRFGVGWRSCGFRLGGAGARSRCRAVDLAASAPGLPALVATALIVWRFIAFLRRREPEAAGRIGEAALSPGSPSFSSTGGVLASPIVPRALSADAASDRCPRRGCWATGCPSLRAATTGYREPSLVFLMESDFELTDPTGAARFLAGGPCRTAFIAQSEEKAFSAALPPGAGAPNFKRLRGYNLSRGNWLVIDVWTRGR